MAYLGELKKQIDSIPSSKGTPSFDFEQAIARNSVISISVNNQLNDLLISVITEHLRELFRTNDNITVVLDGINIHSDNNLIKMLKQNSRCNFAISIEDAYASTGAKKDELNALLGGDCRLVLFRHGSPRSAEYWSEYFGEYERTEITESFTEGEKRLMTPAELKRGWAPRKTKERRILSDVFKNFSDTQFCAYDAATGRIILADVKNQ
ncbi:hypothetical protein AGMMS49975_08270 [Clostridia bacterium]|nr:hypothetical protein AGMMS49975_08270 [Clostridia bacterium]